TAAGIERIRDISLVRTAHAPLIEEARSIDHRAGCLEDWLTPGSFAEVRCSRRVCSCAGEALEPESVSPAVSSADRKPARNALLGNCPQRIPDSERMVASLDRKRLGQILGASGMTIRVVFDEETRRKALAFAADAVRYGI